MNIFTLFHPQTSMIVILGITLLFYIGSFLIKKRYILGAASSFFVIVIASNIAYFSCFYFYLSSDFFIPLFIFFFFCIFKTLKIIYRDSLPPPKNDYSSIKLNHSYILLFISVSIYIFLYSTFTVWDASSGSHFFQAWYPLYSAYVATSTSFNFPDTSHLSGGFLLSGQYYAPNTLGIVLLGAMSGIESPKNLFYLYNGVCIISTILTFSLLVSSLSSKIVDGSKQQRYQLNLAQVLFSILFIIYSTFETNLKLVLVHNFSDEIVYLSGALICYFLSGPNEYYNNYKRYSLIILASSFMVLGRNYGLFFVTMFSLLYVTLVLKTEYKKNKTSFLSVLISLIKEYKLVIFIITVVCLKEVSQIVIFGSHFPRNNLPEISPYSLELFLSGLLSGLNLAYLNKEFHFNVNSLYLCTIVFCFLIYKRLDINNKSDYIHLLLSPLLLLILPLILEWVTQYRKSTDFSKLFIPFIWFSIWYTAYFYRVSFIDLLESEKFKNHRVLKCGYFFCIIIFITYIFWLPQHRFSTYNDAYQNISKGIHYKLKGTTLYPRHEQLLAKKLKTEASENKMKEIINRPVIYFHYEPSLGFRYYVGGNIEKDLDFFSPSVQKILSNSTNIDDFFCKLNYPNILFYSQSGFSAYKDHNAYKIPKWFDREFNILLDGDDSTIITNGHNLKFYQFKRRPNNNCARLKAYN